MKTLVTTLGRHWFFAFQILMAYYFAIPQALRMLETTQGVTINWLLCADLFVILNLYLMVGTYRAEKQKTVGTRQAIAIYSNWVLLVTPMVIMTFFKCKWTRQDSIVAACVAAAVLAVLFWGKMTNRSLRTDALMKGMLVGLFRVVPHLYLSYCIVSAGSSTGISPKTVLAANVTATARIVTLVNNGRKTNWRGGVKASLFSELANELSWLLVTVIWYIYYE